MTATAIATATATTGVTGASPGIGITGIGTNPVAIVMTAHLTATDLEFRARNPLNYHNVDHATICRSGY